MEVDECYSDLSGKISDLSGKVDDLGGKIDSLQSASGGSDVSDLKSALAKAQSDIQQLSDTVTALKAAADGAKSTGDQQSQGVFDRLKAIEAANAASQKAAQDQAGLLGKLAAQADEAGKMIANFGDTTNAIVQKAWNDGKAEILNTWESSKKDIMNSISSITTGLIKDAKDGIKSEIQDGLKSMVLDDVKSAEADAKSSQPDLSDAAIEEKIRKILKEVQAGG